MRFHAIAVLMPVFLIGSPLLADFAVFPLCTENDVQEDPVIDGDIVAWEDHRYGIDNPEIYWLRLSDPNRVQNRIELPGKQVNPSVCGSTIVWQDERVTSNRDIYMYNIEDGTITSLPESYNQRKPDLSGEVIVCESLAGGVYNIAAWNAAAGGFDFVAPCSALQQKPAVDGHLVVWEEYCDGIYQVYGCDLSSRPWNAVALLPAAVDQLRAAVSGSIIVWEEAAAEMTTLKAYDLLTRTVLWTHDLPRAEANACIADGIIVWQEMDMNENGFDIRGYNLNTGVYLDIATGSMDDRCPVISDKTVVWQRGQTDIVAAIVPGAPTTDEVIVLAPNGGEVFLAGSNIPVTWAMVRGETPDAVDIDVSSDNGGNWTRAAYGVPFSETLYWDSADAVDSTKYLIRVSVSGNPQITDASDAAFTVFQCSPLLTADLTGDCFVDLQDVAVLAGQWLTGGNPYEASSN